MGSVAGLRARVARLERATRPRVGFFTSAYGSFDAFEAETMAEVEAGKLDRDDMAVVLFALRKWEDSDPVADGRWQFKKGSRSA
ncbi:hypothetical protein [Novosphingobium humi]|uniref:hypothetical protein n=1 Tax=Novosphingobium humi TaxID=2282397 RepID=UPI0025B20801|nr:hypothetical protein [Novosphingobium humi]WJS98919.1 hypothetical protein NYQ05_01825 [Novosphingobium humi]